jgi:hypothetical protein
MWLRHFVKTVKSKDCWRVGIIKLSLPGDTSHRLHSLGVAVVRLFVGRTNCYVFTNQPRTVCYSRRNGHAFGYTYGKKATVATAISLFRTTGTLQVKRYMYISRPTFVSFYSEYSQRWRFGASLGWVTKWPRKNSKVFREKEINKQIH